MWSAKEGTFLLHDSWSFFGFSFSSVIELWSDKFLVFNRSDESCFGVEIEREILLSRVESLWLLFNLEVEGLHLHDTTIDEVLHFLHARGK